MKEPFWGPNAIPMAFQLTAAFVIWHFVTWIGVGRAARYLACQAFLAFGFSATACF